MVAPATHRHCYHHPGADGTAGEACDAADAAGEEGPDAAARTDDARIQQRQRRPR